MEKKRIAKSARRQPLFRQPPVSLPKLSCHTATIRVHEYRLKSGISRTAEFARKGLAEFAVNIGTKCGHDCAYCSSGALLRMHASFRQTGENSFQSGYCIVDPTTPDRVAADARRIQQRGTVQLCTTVDAWAPEAQAHELGRRCLQAMLEEPGWIVRVLTKNAAVAKDFDLIEQYRDRVLVGLSLTATHAKSHLISIIEPQASPVEARMEVIAEAHRRGLRTYGMLCPLLPGIADDQESVCELVSFCLANGAEEVFAEPVNGRGPGLSRVEGALRVHGYLAEATTVGAVRRQAEWSTYAVRLLAHLQSALRSHGRLDALRFLLYPSRLIADSRAAAHGSPGVKWLSKDT